MYITVLSNRYVTEYWSDTCVTSKEPVTTPSLLSVTSVQTN